MISADNLSEEIREYLISYNESITEGIKKTVDIVSKEVNTEIKNHINFKQPTGKYVKSFRVKRTYDKKNKRMNTWYVANGEHRLSHLLEYGHVLYQGGRTKAYPHIKYGEELAVKRMEQLAKEVIENA